MTHPFKPHIFNTLGTMTSDSLAFADTKKHRSNADMQLQTVNASNNSLFRKLASRKQESNYSMPTRALIYCSLS